MDPTRPAPPVPVRDGALASRRAPLRGTVVLLLDHSSSMADAGKMPQLRQGALRFFYEAWQRDFAVGAVAFSRRARWLCGATRDPHRFGRRVAGLEPEGRTAMAAAIRLASGRLRRRRGERLLVLITDGMPDSPAAALQAAAQARALGIPLVAIGTDGADSAFLAALAGRPALARTVAPTALAGALADAGGDLGHRRGRGDLPR